MKPTPTSGKKVVLFDFDGTIADTMLPGLRISNQLADKYHFRKVQQDELAQYRGKSTRDALKGVKLSWYKLPFVARSFRKAMQGEIAKITPFKGIANVIRELHKKGYTLGIITSNAEDNIEEFLINNQMSQYFTFKRCGIGLFKKHHYITKLLSKRNINPDEAVLVADETRDIEAASKSGIDIISVAWGFHPKSTLHNYHPNYLIDAPEQLLDIL